MADFNKNTAHEELITHALEKTSETGITETNKEKLKQALEEKEGETLKIKIETKEELEKLKTNIVTKLKLKQAEWLTEAEIKETATEIIEESKTPETEKNTETIDKTAPEVPEVEHNLPPLENVNIPENVQEEMAKYSPKPGNIGKFVQDFILNFMAGFAPDWVAKVRWFGNATLEKKADAWYNTLVSDESRALLEGSPLSNILILDHIEKNDFKKILAEYPTLDFSNKTHIEAAFLGKHASNPNLIKYHRIYQGMGEMQTELSNPESIGYNPEERLKKLLSYSRQEDMEIEKYEPTISITPQQEQVPMNSSSPEVQKELMTQATELDEALAKARAMPEWTTEEKTVKEEAMKNAQEKIEKITKKAENWRQELGTELTNLEKEQENKNKEIEKVRNKNIQPSEPDYDKVQEEIKRLEEEQKTTDLKIIELKKIQEKVKDMKNITAEDAYNLITIISDSTYDAEDFIRRNIEKPDNIEAIKKELDTVRETFSRKKIIDENINDLTWRNIDTKSTLNGGIQLLKKYQNDWSINTSEEYTNLKKVVEYSKAKTDLIITAVKKKIELKNKWLLINFDDWNKISDDTVEKTRGWAEIEENLTADSIEFDVYDEWDSWSMSNDEHFAWETDTIVQRLWNLSNVRKILWANENIIKTNTDVSEINYTI